MENLDSVDRFDELRSLIERKSALKKFYREIYQKYADCLKRCPPQGRVVELGSGAGFVKEVIPEVIKTDVIEYPHLDQVVDATRMPFPANSIRAIFMLNVFHHIPDVEAFFRESERCLVPGGRIFMMDQNRGWISSWILKHMHHEPFVPDAVEWKFNSTGPLSGANGALAWIVFKRDLLQFKNKFPKLRMEYFRPHSPLRYWLAGGLKSWSLLPGCAFGAATALDALLTRLSPQWGSFVDIEIVKTS